MGRKLGAMPFFGGRGSCQPEVYIKSNTNRTRKCASVTPADSLGFDAVEDDITETFLSLDNHCKPTTHVMAQLTTSTDHVTDIIIIHRAHVQQTLVSYVDDA